MNAPKPTLVCAAIALSLAATPSAAAHASPGASPVATAMSSNIVAMEYPSPLVMGDDFDATVEPSVTPVDLTFQPSDDAVEPTATQDSPTTSSSSLPLEAETTQASPTEPGIASELASPGLPAVSDDPTVHAHDEANDEPAAPTQVNGWFVSSPQSANDVVMVGADWGGTDDVRVEIRSETDGESSPWYPMEYIPDEAPDGEEGSVPSTASAPVWLGRTDTIQVRTTASDPDAVELIGVVLEGSMTRAQPEPELETGTASILPAMARSSAPTAMQVQASTTAVTEPVIITRSQWGADESLRSTQDPVYMDRISFAAVHHTAGGNDYALTESDDIVRSIYVYHTQSRGWWDIGYNFLVDKYGQVFEGRYGGIRRAVRGSHSGSLNGGSTGISLIGNHDQRPASAAAQKSLAETLAWKFAIHDVDPHSTTVETISGSINLWPSGTSVELNAIIGHRDAMSTSCPGSYVYSLISSGTLADTVADLMPSGTARVVPPPGATPLSGDWNGDGQDTPGWFLNGQWGLHDGYEPDSTTRTLAYGQAGDKPVTGDWDGDGIDTVGVVRGNLWILRSDYHRGADDVVMAYGRASDKPVVGDWDGDGVDTLGVVRGNLWILRSEYRRGADDVVMAYGRASDKPVVGDWDGDGVDTLGVVRGNLWILRSEYRRGADDIVMAYGKSSDTPLTGNWNGDARDTLGVRRGDLWIMRIFYRSGGDVSYVY